MFILLELNVPLVVGDAVNWYVTSRSKDAALNAERGEKGTLLASGFIAGGALMGVVSAAMRFGGVNMVNDDVLSNTWSEVLALGAYAILIFYLVKASMKNEISCGGTLKQIQIIQNNIHHEKDSISIPSVCRNDVVRTESRRTAVMARRSSQYKRAGPVNRKI